jgi:FkbM family methyltransferase
MNNGKQRYYSQHGEDFLLWNFFGYESKGFFVDVGAFDGIHLSNTYSLEEQGWSGICIEPHPKYFPFCKKTRKNSICLAIACVGEEGVKQVDFNIEESGLYSGISRDDAAEISYYYKHGWGIDFPGFRRITVPAMTLNRILDKYLPSGSEIDVISIDVEGTELDVLRGLDLDRFKPRILLIEAAKDEAEGVISSYLNRFGYIKGRELRINKFYVRELADADRLEAIHVQYLSERNLHPLGKEYTLRPFKESIYRSETKMCLDELKTCRAQLARKDKELIRYQEKEKELSKEVETLKVKMDRIARELESMAGEKAELASNLNKMQSSWMWRLTAPFRKESSTSKY